jgi:hypothetical protein
MCSLCALDLRALWLTEVAALRDDRSICAELQRRIDAELAERLEAQDLADPCDEER